MGIMDFLRDVANVRQINATIRRALERRRKGGRRMARILVVDDDPLVVRMLERTLVGAGHSVVTALDGEQARLALSSEPPVDLVITDIDLPEIDGLQMIASLRRDGSTTPILALSARTGRESRLSMATAFGADRTLVKPFDLRQLLDAVEQLISD